MLKYIKLLESGFIVHEIARYTCTGEFLVESNSSGTRIAATRLETSNACVFFLLSRIFFTWLTY